MALVVCRIQKHNNMGKIGAASSHNFRLESEANREHILPTPDGIRLLRGTTNIVTDVKNRLKDADKCANGKFRKNAVFAVEMVLSASPDYFSDEKALQVWIDKNLEWLDKQYGKNLVNVVLHIDEQTPHLQLFIVPIDSENQLNCRGFFGGKEKLKELQTNSYLAVKSLGIKRGIPKEITGATHKKTATWRREQADIEASAKSLTAAIENIEPIQTNFTGLVKGENADLYYKEKAKESLKKSTPSKMVSLTKENNVLKTKYNKMLKEKTDAEKLKEESDKKLLEAERIAKLAKKKLFEERDEIKREREDIANAITEAYENAIDKVLENVEKENIKENLKNGMDKKQIKKNIKNSVLPKLR